MAMYYRCRLETESMLLLLLTVYHEANQLSSLGISATSIKRFSCYFPENSRILGRINIRMMLYE